VAFVSVYINILPQALTALPVPEPVAGTAPGEVLPSLAIALPDKAIGLPVFFALLHFDELLQYPQLVPPVLLNDVADYRPLPLVDHVQLLFIQ
jgi:hypothetical protein